ncbi:hypothetical protein [Anaerosinus massiliensis]|uniref:hypothetical protein n=1 Tax=Massilibacillus massiliensis TaxID=1806837 RepID=UPI0018FF033B|nr:hypothetical protein [Massilibacillus massiliensis]
MNMMQIGYLNDEQYLKLKESFQIEFMLATKLLPEEFYSKYKKIFNSYDRETNGLLSDKIAKILMDKQLGGSEITNMLPQLIKGKECDL